MTQTTDGKLVVESTALKQIERGSVILAVNDKPISEIIDNYRSILPSSNEHGLLRNVAFRLFVTSENEMKVTVENQGSPMNMRYPCSLLKEHLLKVGRVRQITDWMPERFFM